MKPFWKSKTMWVNVLTVLTISGDALLGTHLLDPTYAAVAVVGLAIVNAVLRIVTSTGVSLK